VDLTEGDNTNPTAKLVRQILAAVAEFDRCVIELKLRAARERKRAQGVKCEGRKAYGEKPGEEAVLQLIRQRSAQGWSPDFIAMRLNEDKVPTRLERHWHGATISKILARKETLCSVGE